MAIDKARQVAETRGVSVDWVAADVTAWQPPTDSFDLVMVLYLQVPAEARGVALGSAARALAPGGTLIVVAHDSANLERGSGGPQDPAVLYTADDVRADLERAGVALTIERAETIERVVEGADRPALDCLVRPRR